MLWIWDVTEWWRVYIHQNTWKQWFPDCPTEFTPIVSFHMCCLFHSDGSLMLPCSPFWPVIANSWSLSAPRSSSPLDSSWKLHLTAAQGVPGKALLFPPLFSYSACFCKHFLPYASSIGSVEFFYRLSFMFRKLEKIETTFFISSQ